MKLCFKRIKVSLSCRIKAKIKNIDGCNIFCYGSYFDGHIGKYSIIGPDSRIIGNIGRYCSIGPSVKTVSGNHPISFYSIHPIVYKKFKCHLDKSFSENLGPVNIGNDVWIGENVLLKGGINIGDGVVIGMGSVVTKDVPPYSVVAGCPAKVIKTRFESDTIKRFLNSNWYKKDIEDLQLNDFLNDCKIGDVKIK